MGGTTSMAAVAPLRRSERTAIARMIRLTTVVGVVMVVLLPAAVPPWGLRHDQDGINGWHGRLCRQ
jgi:hypothetical protein